MYYFAGIHDGLGPLYVIIGAVVVCWLIMMALQKVIEGLPSKWRNKSGPEDDGVKKFTLPQIQFTDSNWVVLYKFCGWVGIIIALIVIFQGQYMTAVYFVCMGLSAFLAAHILRLLEKGVHHLENLDKRDVED